MVMALAPEVRVIEEASPGPGWRGPAFGVWPLWGSRANGGLEVSRYDGPEQVRRVWAPLADAVGLGHTATLRLRV